MRVIRGLLAGLVIGLALVVLLTLLLGGDGPGRTAPGVIEDDTGAEIGPASRLPRLADDTEPARQPSLGLR